MSTTYIHELKARGFSRLTNGPIASMIRARFDHVTLGKNQVPVYDYGSLDGRELTFLQDKAGKAWSAEGHVELDSLRFVRVTKP